VATDTTPTGASATVVSRPRHWWWWARDTAGRIQELNLPTHVLALSAQQVLCTAPLVVALSAVLQRETGRGVGSVISRFFGLRAGAEADLDALFAGSGAVSETALVVGLVVAVAFATSLGATQQRGFELLWELPRARVLPSALRQLLWAVVLPLYVVAVTGAGRVGREVGHLVGLGPATETLLQGVATFAFYWWTQRLLLAGRVPWRSLWQGAVAVAVGTVVLVKVSTVVLPGEIEEEVRDYGLIGAVFVLSIWLMVLSAVLLGGILLGVVLAQRRVPRAPTAVIPATPAAAEGPPPGAAYPE
jgi:membrane protein